MKRFSLVGVLAVAILGTAVWSFAASGPGSAVQAPAQALAAAGDKVVETAEKITLFEPLVSSKYAWYERVALLMNVVIASAGLAYAGMLVKQVKTADQGTKRMQEIAQAVREGANAYLYRQFRVVGVLIVLITVALFFAALNVGSIRLPIVLKLDSSLAGVLQGTLVLFVILGKGVQERFAGRRMSS